MLALGIAGNGNRTRISVGQISSSHREIRAQNVAECSSQNKSTDFRFRLLLCANVAKHNPVAPMPLTIPAHVYEVRPRKDLDARDSQTREIVGSNPTAGSLAKGAAVLTRPSLPALHPFMLRREKLPQDLQQLCSVCLTQKLFSQVYQSGIQNFLESRKSPSTDH
jgi:hypothetical protein